MEPFGATLIDMYWNLKNIEYVSIRPQNDVKFTAVQMSFFVSMAFVVRCLP